MASVWAELKRRNVVKVAVAYAIVGWLVVEIAATVLPIFVAPDWILQVFTREKKFLTNICWMKHLKRWGIVT